ncbi:MAG: Flp pilus assembly protein CpaB [Nocardioides sp.]
MPEPAGRSLRSHAARIRRFVRRTVLARRRLLAALCVGVAVLAATRVLQPPAPPTVEVVVASRDLPSGTLLKSADIEVRRYPSALAPAGSNLSSDLTSALGRTLGGPVGRGEPITTLRLVAPSLLAGYTGLVAMPVRVADAGAAALLRPGDRVDLLAADPRRGVASFLAADVAVVSMPRPDDQDVGTSTQGRLVVLAVPPADVAAIAGAAATALLSVVLTR